MSHGDITVHGFRSSFVDWAHEQTAFPLAHVVGVKVEAAYRRGDLLNKRRQFAEAWYRSCTSLAHSGAAAPLRKPTRGA
jgi:hypothetical protein